MNCDQLAIAVLELRPTVTNLLGFHELSNDQARPPTPSQRATYESHMQASGIELARRLLPIMADIEAKLIERQPITKRPVLVVDNDQ